MAKFIVVTAVLALAVGIVIGVNSEPDNTTRGGQVLSNATPASADVPQLDESDPDRITNVERIDAEIAVLNLLRASISERNKEYEALISEITRLHTIRAILEGEIEAAQFVSGLTSGQ